MEINAGYTIRQSVLFDNGRGFALAENPKDPAPFVTWQFTEEQGRRDYYWGHYHTDEGEALGDFNRRVFDYERRPGIARVETQGPDFFKYYSTQRPVDMGTFPHEKDNLAVAMLNYGERRPVEGEPFRAWGEVWYMRPLTKEQVINYELQPAPDNPEHGEPGHTAPKREAPDRGDR